VTPSTLLHFLFGNRCSRDSLGNPSEKVFDLV
jgi:hypothetical protein